MSLIAALAARFRSSETGPQDVAAEALTRASEQQAQAIFTRLTPELARQQAQPLARRFARGRPLAPLDGIPIAWKDLFGVAGTPTTCAARSLRTALPCCKTQPVLRACTPPVPRPWARPI